MKLKYKKNNQALAASVLAGGLLFSSAANAANIVVDGDYGAGGWGGYTAYNHPYSGIQGPQLTAIGTLSDYGVNDNISASAGAQFHGIGGGTQTISLVNADATLVDIAAGGGSFAFSTWFASWSGDGNTPAMQLEFLDSGGAVIGSAITLDRGVTTNQLTTAELLVNGADNGSAADPDFWALYEVKGTVAANATDARLTFVNGTGHAANGGLDFYADMTILDVVAVPEPSSTLLLGLGGLALVLRRRK